LLSIIYNYLIKRHEIYFQIIFITSIISIYSFEIYQNIKPEKNIIDVKSKIYFKNTGKKYDMRTIREIYDDHKSNGSNITVTYKPSAIINNNYNFLPLSGLSNINTIHCNENGYYSIYKSDRYGFNNPDYEWDNQNQQYILIGDSFVHGECVNRPNDISSVLREISNKSVLNLGYRGNGPLLKLATLKEFSKTKKNKILWFYFEGNDQKELVDELKDIILKKYFFEDKFSQSLLKKNELKDKFLLNLLDKNYNTKSLHTKKNKKEIEFKKTDFRISELIKLNKTRNIIHKVLPGAKSQEIYPMHDKFINVIEKAKFYTERNNSKLYFIYLPQYARYAQKNYHNENYDRIKSAIKKLNIELIDINEEVFSKEKNPLSLFPFKLNGHYNIEGYKKIAYHIYQRTSDN
tara:strand:+ start:2918 stop:4132 length:1215 start_codon:yes stop_codon:yes gene_type:complete